MCLAIPAQITAIDATTGNAQAALGGVSKEISLALVEDVAVGDYVLVHVGYALNKLSVEDAEATLALIREIGMLEEEADANANLHAAANDDAREDAA